MISVVHSARFRATSFARNLRHKDYKIAFVIFVKTTMRFLLFGKNRSKIGVNSL